MLKFTKNESGFTLLEITIAAGLLGFLALAFLKYQQNQMKSTKTAINKAELSNQFQAMKAYMSKPGTCKRTLEKLGRLEDRLIVDYILRPDGKPKYSIEDKVSGTNYKISSMYLSKLYVNKVEGTEFHRGETVFNIEFTRVNNTSFGGKVITKKLELDMYVDNSNKISDCGVLGGLYLPSSPTTANILDSEENANNEEVNSVTTTSPTEVTTNTDTSDLAKKDDLDKAFENSVKEASQITGQSISQEDINKAIKSNPQLMKAMESLKTLRDSNKKMEELLNEDL